MDGKSVSDSDLLNILQGLNKAEVTTDNTSNEIGNESTTSKQNNNGNSMFQDHSIETDNDDKSKHNLQLEKLNKPVEFGNLSENAEALITNKDIDENVDKPLTNENLINNAKIYENQDDLGDTADITATMEDFKENSYANLSLNVNEAELDMFDDYSREEGKINNLMDVAAVGREDSIQSDVKIVKRMPISHLHCVICNNFLKNPKLLECLHTFCQSCLMKGVKSNYRYIFCELCKQRSSMPKGGIEKLADNVVAASLIASKLEKKKVPECMICNLHHEVNTATDQCLDCGDIMCKDCSKNHTFSRLTAKHVVVTLEEAQSGQKESESHCLKHSDEIGEYFCLVCCVPLCNKCKQSSHRLHKCDLLEDVVAGKREHIRDNLDTLRKECARNLVDDTDESRSLIHEHKKAALEKLECAKDALVAIIDKKYSKCLKQLQEEYDIKTRKYCKHKKTNLRFLNRDINHMEESIHFLLNEGNDVELAMLENIITTALEEQRSQLGKLHPKLTEQSHFPETKILTEHAKIVETMTFFTKNQNYSEKNYKDCSEKRARSEMHSENVDNRMKVGRKFKN